MSEIHFTHEPHSTEVPVMTTYHAVVACECGGRIEVSGETENPVAMITATGVPCDSCDKTYTMELRADDLMDLVVNRLGVDLADLHHGD